MLWQQLSSPLAPHVDSRLEQLRNCDGTAASTLASPLALPFPPSMVSPPTSAGRGKPHEAVVSTSSAMLTVMDSVSRVLWTTVALSEGRAAIALEPSANKSVVPTCG